MIAVVLICSWLVCLAAGFLLGILWDASGQPQRIAEPDQQEARR